MSTNYIAHDRYKGKDMFGNKIIVQFKKKLVRVGDLLFVGGPEGRPVCVWRSQVACKYFAANDDGHGLERGAIIRALAFAPATVEIKMGDIIHMQSFTEEQIDILNDKWSQFLDPKHDQIIFTDEFYEADIETLREMAASLNIEYKLP